jgi:hypothetical protein
MHKIEETDYGYRMVLEGFLPREEAGALLRDLKKAIRPKGGPFAVMVDLRRSRAFPVEAQEILKAALRHCKETGMERNACVLDSPIAAVQARRLAQETGVESSSRYIDASLDPDWEKVAVDWLVRAIDPD